MNSEALEDLTEGIAETLLKDLQRVLLEAAPAAAGEDAPARREAIQAVERTYGSRASRYGRLLSELVGGSHAWDLFERTTPAALRLPRVYELSLCEPLLRVMRECGELAERERLLRERDAALAAAWQNASLSEEDRRLATDGVYDDYFDAVQRVSEAYRPHYEDLGRAASGAAAPLAGPLIRSRLFLHPPVMALLFTACHADREPPFLPAEPASAPESEELDEMTWDIAALAVSAFYVRTPGDTIDAQFPLLIDDYFQWRRIDPRKRTRALRRQIEARLALLCSDRIPIRSETGIRLGGRQTGYRRETSVIADGPFLVRRSRFFRRPPTPEAAAENVADGYLLSLGEWARTFVAERTMLGVYLRRLAEYDLQRQQWERRIGWFLVFQMNGQGLGMTLRDVTQDGWTQTLVTPQQPLRMGAVLKASHIAWENMARTNPGKVIRQWRDALETLRRDGVIGSYRCLDGLPDGADLPVRGRLNAMLERRYQFVPGRDLLPHLRVKYQQD